MKKEYRYFVYIITNKTNSVLYIGISNSLFSRVLQHKNKEDKNSFTAKYNINKLVYYELYNDVFDAINREKRLKKWNRDWKNKIIREFNPTWRDLFEDMI